jgi:hypothetical protein
MIDTNGYKIIVGMQYENIHQSPFYPNSSFIWSESDVEYQDWTCGGGENVDWPVFDEIKQTYVGACLYNILTDPGEYNNIASLHPEIVQQLSIEMNEMSKTAFNPNRGITTSFSEAVIDTNWNGFMGPWLSTSLGEGSLSCPNPTEPPVCWKQIFRKNKVFVDTTANKAGNLQV